MKNKHKLFLFLTTLILNNNLFAQNAQMADGMRADGKIYVVVAVILTILFGLLSYVVYIDNKIKKMEKELE